MRQPHPAQGRILQFLQKDPEDTLWYARDLVAEMNKVKTRSEATLNLRSIGTHLNLLVAERLVDEEFETPEEQERRMDSRHYSTRKKRFKISKKGRRSKSTAKKIIANNKRVRLTSENLRKYFDT